MAYDYTSLQVVGVRDELNGLVYFGVVVEGAFVQLGVRKLGGLDAKIAEAREAAAATTPPPPAPAPTTEPPPPAPSPAG